jgi:cytochrome c oxidase cbb3-type subunit 3
MAADAPQPMPGAAVVTAVPLGPLAGAAACTLAASLPNPDEGDAQAVEEGHALFIKMNCAGCHGYGAKGGMGPNLTDPYWRYGGVPAQIFNSIYQGRPQGMPAWNPALPMQDIWKLVAYIQSLGGAYPPHQYQAWLQGDRHGDIVPPDVATAAKDEAQSHTIEASTPQPKGGTPTPPTVPSAPDVSPPKGPKQ